MSIDWSVVFHEISIGFKLIEVAFIGLFALLFFLKMNKKEETRNQKEIYLGTAIFLLCYLASNICFLLAYYGLFYSDFFFYNVMWKIATILGISGTGFFIFIIEKNIDIIKRLNTRFAFTIISAALFIAVIIINIDIGRILVYLSLPIVFLLVLAFHFYIYLKAPQEYKQDLFLSFLGFLIFLISYTLPTEIARSILGLPLDLLVIISSILIILGIGIYTLKIPPNAELEWHQNIIALLIIHSVKGIKLHDYSFVPVVADQSDLIAGGLVGISSIIKEMTESETQLKVIKQEKAIILLEHGEKVTCALIAKRDLQILRMKLRVLLEEFNTLFKDQLRDWSGDILIFQPVKRIIDKVFETSKFFTGDD